MRRNITIIVYFFSILRSYTVIPDPNFSFKPFSERWSGACCWQSVKCTANWLWWRISGIQSRSKLARCSSHFQDYCDIIESKYWDIPTSPTLSPSSIQVGVSDGTSIHPWTRCQGIHSRNAVNSAKILRVCRGMTRHKQTARSSCEFSSSTSLTVRCAVRCWYSKQFNDSCSSAKSRKFLPFVKLSSLHGERSFDKASLVFRGSGTWKKAAKANTSHSPSPSFFSHSLLTLATLCERYKV